MNAVEDTHHLKKNQLNFKTKSNIKERNGTRILITSPDSQELKTLFLVLILYSRARDALSILR